MAISLTKLSPMWEVFDLPASMAFYQDVLGFERVSYAEGWWCMLQHGSINIMLNTAYEKDKRPAVPDAARVRGHADAELYFDTPDPKAVYDQLREKGWPASEPNVTHYGFLEVTTKDPDGFVLHFLCPAK
jgi:glyoxylase I family protein